MSRIFKSSTETQKGEEVERKTSHWFRDSLEGGLDRGGEVGS